VSSQDGGLPPTDPGPTPPANIAGSYSGTVLHQNGSPTDHCYAEWLVIETGGAGHAFPLAVTVSQQGSQITATTSSSQLPMTCAVAGTVSGVLVNWRHTDCTQPCTTFGHAKLPCPTLRVCTVDQSFAGEFRQGRLQSTYDLFLGRHRARLCGAARAGPHPGVARRLDPPLASSPA